MTTQHRYSILCANKLKPPITPEKAARVILEHLDLDQESFRFGNTKVLKHHLVDCIRLRFVCLELFACS